MIRAVATQGVPRQRAACLHRRCDDEYHRRSTSTQADQRAETASHARLLAARWMPVVSVDRGVAALPQNTHNSAH